MEDLDAGVNADLVLECDSKKSPTACAVFEVSSRGHGNHHKGWITLRKGLDYETQTSYTLPLVVSVGSAA